MSRTFEFVTRPFSHQSEVFEATKDIPRYALFWEMGTGKTKIVLDKAQYLYLSDQINTLVVLAPNGVHRNWVTDEIPVHWPEWLQRSSRILFWQQGKCGTQWYQKELRQTFHHEGMVVLAMPYTSVITKEGKKWLYKFLEERKCFYVADEAVHFKNPNAKRTKTIHATAKYAQWRRVLTGTPIANGPFDAYAIMKFLDLGFWKPHGLDNFAMFKSFFGVWQEGHNKSSGKDLEYKFCVAYKNLDELKRIMSQHSDRRLKEQVLDLPPKLYTKRYFELSRQQRKIYDELKEEFMTYLEATDDLITAPLAITRLLRLQQVVSGYIPADGGDPVYELNEDGDPRMRVLEELIEEIPHSAIIFAKFTRDIDKIMNLLGDKAVRYDGRVDDDQRAENKRLFQAGEKQWFVANQAVASEGLTLVIAKSVIYYNNSYKLTERLQSEDRAHRIGQTHPVNYHDIVAEDTVDVGIVNALRKKRDVANIILGDEFRTWL